LVNVDGLPIGKKTRETLRAELPKAIERFQAADPIHFSGLLKPRDAWRLFSSFPERCVCFDIETTGLAPGYDDITVICTYAPHTRTFRKFVRGEDLDQFPGSVKPGDILVGFNSRGFDMPFIECTFGNSLPDIGHVDIRWVLYALDVKGPLKEIESAEFGVARPPSIQGFGGDEAVAAWHEYRRTGNRSILNLLTLYCSADAFVLDFLAREACRRNGCSRFSQRIDPRSIFPSHKSSQWARAMPDVPPQRALEAKQPQTRVLPPVELVEELDEQVSEEERQYERVFLIALVDECIAKEERFVLDLFATRCGLSTRQQEEAEWRAREFHTEKGFPGITEMILSQGRKRAIRDLQRMMIFAFVDRSLDERERKLILAIATALKLTQAELDEMRFQAVRKGQELTARMK